MAANELLVFSMYADPKPGYFTIITNAKHTITASDSCRPQVPFFIHLRKVQAWMKRVALKLLVCFLRMTANVQ